MLNHVAISYFRWDQPLLALICEIDYLGMSVRVSHKRNHTRVRKKEIDHVMNPSEGDPI